MADQGMEAGVLLSVVRAVVAIRHGGGPKRLTRQLRVSGPTVLDGLFSELTSADKEAVEQESQELVRRGIRASILGDLDYPALLAATREAPPALFYLGTFSDLKVAGLGMCGARNASPEGLRAASACGTVVAASGLTVVSGYARGVDMATHLAALRAGGRTLLVLAEGITRFRVKRGEFADEYDADRVTVISQFSPTQPWSPGNAMTRNAVIFSASLGLVVIEAGESGGTLDAGLRALAAGRPVLALQFDGMLPGNKVLIRQGAVPVRSKIELESILANWGTPGNGPAQLALL
jgi:DNA processing protein